VISDPLQDAAEIEFRITPVELGCPEQRINRSGTFAAGIGARKEIVLPS